MPQPEFSEELLLDAFKGNIANQSDDMPVYQYFGTAGGILYYYPSSNLKMRDCLETDVRYRLVSIVLYVRGFIVSVL